MDVSNISLGAGLFQVRKCMNYEDDEVPDNVTLHLIACASKSCPVQSSDTATLNGKHLAYYMGLKHFAMSALPRKYV